MTMHDIQDKRAVVNCNAQDKHTHKQYYVRLLLTQQHETIDLVYTHTHTHNVRSGDSKSSRFALVITSLKTGRGEVGTYQQATPEAAITCVPMLSWDGGGPK